MPLPPPPSTFHHLSTSPRTPSSLKNIDDVDERQTPTNVNDERTNERRRWRWRRRRQVLADISGYDVVVTTYDMAVGSTMRHSLTRQWWRTVELDEGHKIKNEETDVSEACRKIRATTRVLLTGTPMQVGGGWGGWNRGGAEGCLSLFLSLFSLSSLSLSLVCLSFVSLLPLSRLSLVSLESGGF